MSALPLRDVRMSEPRIGPRVGPTAAAEEVRRSAIGPEELADLVRSFTQVTERLQATHVALDEQVGRLKGELAEANERLRRSRELAALGEMAAGIAHEIRNPLGSIALDMEGLREDLGTRPELSGVCERVLRSVERLDQIVGDVLRFARDGAPQFADADPRQAIDVAVHACEAPARRYGVAIEVGPTGDVPARFDAHLIAQAIANLLRNAIEATAVAGHAGGRVRIDARRARRAGPDGRRSEHLVFRIDDGGAGVPEELLERIFHPFFTTRPEGTGLGLAIVHRIADAHGGAITVRNRIEGDRVVGARFELALPLEPAACERAARFEDGLDAAVRRRIGRIPAARAAREIVAASGRPSGKSKRERSRE